MKYQDVPAVKNGLTYNVKESLFNKEFDNFEKSYTGSFELDGKTIEAPAYRAFEILAMNKKILETKNVEKQIQRQEEKRTFGNTERKREATQKGFSFKKEN